MNITRPRVLWGVAVVLLLLIIIWWRIGARDHLEQDASPTVPTSASNQAPAADLAQRVKGAISTARARLNESEKLRTAIDVPMGEVRQVDWRPDGKALVLSTGGVRTGKEKRNIAIVLTEVAGGFSEQKLELPDAGHVVGFTPDGKQLWAMLSGEGEAPVTRVKKKARA